MSAAFVYLGLGLAYTFFGAKFVRAMISLLSGLLAAAVPFIFIDTGSVSTGMTIACFALFCIVAGGCWRFEHLHSAILGLGVGTYVGSVGWALFFNFFAAPAYTKFIVEGITAIIFAWYGYEHAHKFMVHATAFLGANMIATSITLFT